MASDTDKVRKIVESEWLQLQDAAYLYKTQCVGARRAGLPPARGLQTALFDSFAVHTRTLTCFLFPVTPRKDDLAADRPPVPSRYSPGLIPAILKSHLIKANKQVNHLTKAHLEPVSENDAWPIDDLMDEMDKQLQHFATATGGVFSFKRETYPDTPAAPATAPIVAGSTRS